MTGGPRPRAELAAFAALVDRVVVEHGMAALASAMGAHERTIYYWRRARTEPLDALLVKFCRVIQVPVREVALLLPSFAPFLTDRPGAVLVDARWSRYWTVDEAAEHVGVPAGVIRYWELAESGAPPDHVLEQLEVGYNRVLPRQRWAKGPAAPLPWVGSKANFVGQLSGLVPMGHTYVEPFGGGGSLLFARQPADQLEVYNDLNGDLVNLFRVLRSKTDASELKRRLELTLWSREEYTEAQRLLTGGGDRLDRAWAMFVSVSQSYNFRQDRTDRHWSSTNHPVRRGWWRRIAFIDEWHERLAGVVIEREPALDLIGRLDGDGVVMYLDPPYERATRKCVNDLYRHDNVDHRKLVDVVRDARAAVVLSGYPSEVYAPLRKAGWEQRRVSGREHVWRNPAAIQMEDAA